MTVTLTATLLSGADPRPVQVVLNGTTSGQAYEISGTTADGSRWAVPGGAGVSEGSQILRIDNRPALNQQTTYSALVDGVTYTASPVTVSGPLAVLQTIDGLTVVEVDIASVTDARAHDIRSKMFDVAGRSDPASRLDVPGSAEYSWAFETQRLDSVTMLAILQSGMPVVRRLSPGMRDLQLVALGVVTSWSDELITEGFDTWRRWSLKVREIADPQPSTPLIAFTWDDFDAAMADRVWGGGTLNFDGLFTTWDEFDAADWSLL